MAEPDTARARLVPAEQEVQHGYELPCRELTGPLAGVRLFGFEGGNPDPARSLVCLPGLGASGRSFAPMAPLAQGLHFILWTPPLETPRAMSPLWNNVRLLALHQAPLPRRFSLLGSSYGSLIALAFALHSPLRLRSLILVSPVASPRRIRVGVLAASTAMQVPVPLAYPVAPVVARILGGSALPPDARAEIVRESRRMTAVEMARRLRDILRNDFLGELSRLTIPVLVIHGGRDRVVPLASARDLVKRLPGARLEVIRDAAHLPYMSHPREFNACVSRFLQDVGG